jgi:phosphoglycerol transferase MdoB-like AlkP superfamily enzyme
LSYLHKIKKNFPELILLSAVVFYWIATSIVFNPVAVGLALLLLFQIIFKHKIMGILIPSFLILICLYMLMALFSEFNEFPTFSRKAKELLFVGLTIFISTIAVSGLMIFKYSRTNLE